MKHAIRSNHIDPLLDMTEVEAMVGLKRAAIDKRIAKGAFPAKLRFKGARYVRFRKSAIEQWLEDQLVS